MLPLGIAKSRVFLFEVVGLSDRGAEHDVLRETAKVIEVLKIGGLADGPFERSEQATSRAGAVTVNLPEIKDFGTKRPGNSTKRFTAGRADDDRIVFDS